MLDGHFLYILKEGQRKVTQHKGKIKKRGSSGGIKNRLRRRGTNQSLPVITLSNVRSLNNKLDELIIRVKREDLFRCSKLICLTET